MYHAKVNRILIKYSLRNHRTARKLFITLKQPKRRIKCVAASGIAILINRQMMFSVTNLCFKLLITVLAIELGNLTMKDLVQFELRRLLGMVIKFTPGDFSYVLTTAF